MRKTKWTYVLIGLCVLLSVGAVYDNTRRFSPALNVTNNGDIRLMEAKANGSNYISLIAPASIAANDTLIITGDAPNAITDTASLTSSDCGKVTTVSAGIDTKTITLPEASTVLGCEYKIVYIGADGGALLDITPLDSDADGIEGGCTLAASVVTFSGTADADIGLTKATGLTGDYIRLTAVSSSMWAVTGCQGIWANN